MADLIRQHGGDCDPVTLVGIWEISRVYNVSTQAVNNWSHRHTGFPDPVARLRMGPVYLMEDVEKWYESRVSYRRDK